MDRVSHTIQGEITKDIVRGIAFTCFIFAISFFIPFFAFFSIMLIPLPILLYRAKLGRKYGAWVPLISLIFMTMITGGMNFYVLLFAELMLLGYVMADIFERRLSVEKTILYSSGIVLFTGFFVLSVYANIMQKSLGGMASEYMAKIIDLAIVIYGKMGMPEENIRLFEKLKDEINYVLVRLLPATAAATMIFLSWATLLMSKRMLTVKGLSYPDFGALNRWKAPDHMAWAAIASAALVILPTTMPLRLIGISAAIVLMTIFFFQGIAVVSFHFEKKDFPLALRVLIYSLIALQHFFLLFVIGMGFFDIWIDFRKLKSASSPPDSP